MASQTPLDHSEAKTLLAVAVAAASLAGQQLRQGQPNDRQIEKTAAHDVKIAADRRAESLILDHLRARTPYAILSEEAGLLAAQGPASSLTWIIDPLDGSLNYYQGIPLCCISVALYDGWEPVLGVVYDFNRGELFTGIVGHGAHCNDLAICPSSAQHRQEAVLATGFPVSRDFAAPALQAFIDQIRDFRKVRLLGSAALSLSYVACGRLDAYTEENIMLWDVAGGCALVKAAGGRVEQRRGADFQRPVTVYADNGKLERGAQ
jgi:myo-inositol-1(or 4)-monophosphatase